MKQITLDESWEECLKQWDWIIKKLIEKGLTNDEEFIEFDTSYMTVEDLKKTYLTEHHIINLVRNECFFCEYAGQQNEYIINSCYYCPMAKVDTLASCSSFDQDYAVKPFRFYKMIKRLNKIRTTKTEGVTNETD